MQHNFWTAGIDEAGRGPLAGPVTAACVCLPKKFRDSAIGDSKKLSAAERELAEVEIKSVALAFSVVSVGHHRIERLNIREATRTAMLLASNRVFAQLSERHGIGRIIYLIDGNTPIATSHAQETIVKGDDTLLAISAASILAKVARDRLMSTLSQKYTGYGFEQHKGYATDTHRRQIVALGPSPVHRRTFAGVREHLPQPKNPRESLALFV